METYHNFINGKWAESASSKTVNNLNPANTDDVIGTVKQATREEARAAVDAAAEAFHSWRRTPAPTRGKIVAKAARLMEEAKEELAQLLTREEGKTISESRGELQRSINVADRAVADGIASEFESRAEKLGGGVVWEPLVEVAYVVRPGKLVGVSISYTSSDPPATELKPEAKKLVKAAARRA